MSCMKELSEYLKSERLKQGLTLTQVSERAHLSVNMLQTLEDQDFERIGTPLLIRSFVKAYCKALGLDPTPLLDQYQKQILAFDRQAEGIRQYGRWTRVFRQKGRRGIYLFLILIVAVAVAAFGVKWFMQARNTLPGTSGLARGIYQEQELPVDLGELKNRGGGKDLPKESQSGSEGLPEGVPRADAPPVMGKPGEVKEERTAGDAATPGDVLPQDKSRPEGSDPRKNRFEVEATQKTWVQVKVDGKKTLSIMLQPGEKREWEVEDNIQVVVGNGGGVNLKWNGQNLGSPGKPGRILRMRFPNPDNTRRTP